LIFSGSSNHNRALAQAAVAAVSSQSNDVATKNSAASLNTPALPLASRNLYETGSTPTTVTTIERQRIWSSSFAFGYGYDTAVDDNSGVSAPFTLAEGMIGLAIKKRRYTLLLQHDARFAKYISKDYGLQQYQQTSASASGFVSRLTKWSAQLDNGIGSDAARVIGTTVVNPTSANQQGLLGSATAINQGLTLSDYGSFRIEHLLWPSVTAEAKVGEYYHHFFQLGTSGQEQDLDLSVRRDWSSKVTSGLEVLTARQSYGGATCLTSSVEAFASARVSRSVRLEGAGGPAITSSGCSGKYLANVLLTSHFPRGASLYVGAARKPSDQFVAGSDWETSAFGGLLLGQPRHLQTRFDAGYASYQVPKPTAVTPDLHGFFISGEFTHRLSGTAELSFTTRYFNQSSGPASNLNKAILLANFVWSREQRPSRLSRTGGLHGDH
jgi:hypothetical protein